MKTFIKTVGLFTLCCGLVFTAACMGGGGGGEKQKPSQTSTATSTAK